MKKRIPWMLLALLLLAGCSAQTPAKSEAKTEPEAVTEPEAMTPQYTLELAEAPDGVIDLSGFVTPVGAAGEGGESQLCAELPEGCTGFSAGELPVYQTISPISRSPKDYNEEDNAFVRAQMNAFLSYLPDSCTIEASPESREYEDACTYIDGKEAGAACNNLCVRDLDSLVPCEEMNAEVIRGMLSSDPILRAACAYRGITEPQVFFYSESGPSSTGDRLQYWCAKVWQKRESARETAFETGFCSLTLDCLISGDESTESEIALGISIIDRYLLSEEIAGTAQTISYDEAVQNLLSGNCIDLSMDMRSLVFEKEDVLGARLVYRSDFLRGSVYYIPIYEFVITVTDEASGTDTTLLRYVPACNAKVVERPASESSAA